MISYTSSFLGALHQVYGYGEVYLFLGSVVICKMNGNGKYNKRWLAFCAGCLSLSFFNRVNRIGGNLYYPIVQRGERWLFFHEIASPVEGK